MEEQNFTSIREITDERAAALLLNTKTMDLFSPFVGTKKSVKEAADEMGMKLANYYFYVKQFEQAGLVEVVEVRSRAGRSTKLYRAVADEFFIPYTLDPLLEQYGRDELNLHKTMWQAILHAWKTSSESMNVWGLRFYKDSGAGFGVTGARSKGEVWDLLTEEPIVLPHWRKLKLNKEKARAMQRELQSVLDHYTEEQDREDEGEHYLVRLAMAPLDE